MGDEETADSKQNSKFPDTWLWGKGRGRRVGSKEMKGGGGFQSGGT